MSLVPAIVQNNLDFICCNKDGKVILSSSSLTGRYWNGSLWCFENESDAPNVEKCVTGIEVSSGICDAAVVGDNRYALGLDSGCLEVYKFDESLKQFEYVFGYAEHDDFISSLSVTSDGSRLITAGADRCIKVWKLDSYETTHTYRPAHAGVIWNVSCSTEEPNIFVSCGQDGKILLFDLRMAKPATVIDIMSLKGGPTCLAWRPTSSTDFVVGDESGSAAVKDIRSANFLCYWQPHSRRVHKMLFSKSEPSCVATCADDSVVHIANIASNEPKIVYSNDDHDDFIRGLAWNSKNELVSCGWDKKVIKHKCLNLS